MTYTVGSLFSGVGGIDLAAHWAGFKTAWFVEKDAYCQRVLARHWPGVAIHDDVFDCHRLPHVDVIVGGFPCQPFSVAGKRQGAKDERFLLPEMLRIISEVQPYAVLFENVPGFPSLNDGAEFKQLLRALAEMGFDAEWGHLRASDFGAPHQRERWFCVAYRHSERRQQPTEQRRAGQAISGGAYVEHAYSGHGNRGTKSNNRGTNGVKVSGYSPLEYTRSQQRQKLDTATSGNRARHGCGRLAANGRKRLPQSRMGGNADGLPARMDFAGWPSRPNEPQHAYEPPRVLTVDVQHRPQQLRALGNAVVPQVVYPIMQAIREWLDSLS